MNLTIKKIIYLLLILLILEIPIVCLWVYSDTRDVHDAEEPLMQETVAQTESRPGQNTEPSTETEPIAPVTSEETAPPQETELEETELEETIPVETEPEESVPEETEPAETLPPETIPVRMTIDEVPHFFQNDYPDYRYGTSTIAKSGSSMTALAMVASYMTDHYYYPDELADDLAHFLGNHYERLQFGSDLLQLSWKRAKDIREVLQAVRDGKVAIILMNEKSIFPSDHHYVVLTGTTEDGLITMLDPNRDNYSRQGIDAYLKNGIKEGYLYAGFEGGWIFDKSEMPEEPFIYEPEPYAKLSRYPGIELTDAEIDLIVDVICMEGASEPFEGQQAIAEVILNRLASGDFGSTVHGIIYAENQFPSVDQLHRAKPTYTQYKAVERALKGPYVVPKNVVFYAKFAVNDNVWGKIGAHTFCYAY